MAIFFTSPELFVVEEARNRIQEIFWDFPDMFAPAHYGDLRFPPGWVDILVLVLKDAASNETNLQIRKLSVASGLPVVEFASGTEAGRKAFQKMLQQVKDYCPCCGSLWADAPRHEHWRGG